MKNMIAFISEHASPLASLGGTDSGGQNVYVAELASALAKRGFHIDIFTRRDDINLPRIVKINPKIRVINIDAGPANPVPKEQLLGFMKKFEQDVLTFIDEEQINYGLVHANFFMSGLVAIGLKKKLDIPVIITFHALGHVRRLHQKESDRFPVERLNIETDLVKTVDLIIAECPQDKQDLISYYNADPSKLRIVPCGFNPSEFYPKEKHASKRAIGIDSDQPLILQLGRMVPRKGIDNVIRAIQFLNDLPVSPKLVIVGGEETPEGVFECDELRRLKTLVHELGLDKSVIFVGRKSRHELKTYYAAADVFVTTPWYEPFGITPLEAMACATPVIGANVGGIKFSVIDGQTGFLVPPNDPEALAERLRVLFNDEELLVQMGEAAFRHVHRNFTWTGVAQEMEAIYNTVLVQHNAQPFYFKLPMRNTERYGS